MSTSTAPSKGFSLEEQRGVLVVTLYWESVMQERVLDELREQVVEQLPLATTAVLVDCRKLTGPATSQFLATLVAIRKAAMRDGLLVCVANLSGPVREAYRVSRLDRIIPHYDNREAALRAVGDYGLGRIAVGKLEPARLTAAATKEKEANVRGTAGSSALAGQASAAIASVADSWSGVRENWRAASQSLTRQQVAQLSAVALALLLVVALAAYIVAPPSSLGAASISDDQPLVFGGHARSTLVGKIEIQRGEIAHGDAGALVFVWRVGEGPQQKVLTKTIYRYLNDALASEKFPQSWMRVARTSETGNFRVGIEPPGEFEVLIISGANERGSTLTSADETKLAQWFDAPRELVGRHPYRLLVQRIDQNEVQLHEAFARP